MLSRSVRTGLPTASATLSLFSRLASVSPLSPTPLSHPPSLHSSLHPPSLIPPLSLPPLSIPPLSSLLSPSLLSPSLLSHPSLHPSSQSVCLWMTGIFCNDRAPKNRMPFSLSPPPVLLPSLLPFCLSEYKCSLSFYLLSCPHPQHPVPSLPLPLSPFGLKAK